MHSELLKLESAKSSKSSNQEQPAKKTLTTNERNAAIRKEVNNLGSIDDYFERLKGENAKSVVNSTAVGRVDWFFSDLTNDQKNTLGKKLIEKIHEIYNGSTLSGNAKKLLERIESHMSKS